MDLGLTDRRLLVTGGSRGLGAAIARALAGEGARLGLAARGSDALTSVATATGGQAIPADLSEPDGPAAAVRAAVGHLGGSS